MSDHDDGRCSHGENTCDRCNAAWSLKRRELEARAERLEEALESVTNVLSVIQDSMPIDRLTAEQGKATGWLLGVVAQARAALSEGK